MVNLEHIYFVSRKMMNLFSHPCFIVLLSYREVVAKVMDTTSKPLDHNRSSCYEHRILPFVDVQAEECDEFATEKG